MASAVTRHAQGAQIYMLANIPIHIYIKIVLKKLVWKGKLVLALEANLCLNVSAHKKEATRTVPIPYITELKEQEAEA